MSRALTAALTTSAQRLWRHRPPLVARVLMYLVVLVVLAALWRAAIGEHGAIAGYDFPAMLWYLTIAEAAVISIDPRLIEQVGSAIGDGSVSVEMLRPVSVVGFRVASSLGESAARFAAVLVAGSAFAWSQVGPPPDLGAFALAVPSALMALTANLAAQHTFAAMAFWVNDAKAAWFLYQKLVFLLGGMLLPLELLPSGVETAARFMPFWPMSYAPGRLASGHLDPLLLVGQAVWLVVLLGIAAYVFGVGQRRLVVAGG
ncbi:MAG TPA: ABC-2 family transporter protein [Actinomycetota bacterium]